MSTKVQVARNGEVLGEFEESQIIESLQSGTLLQSDHYFQEGMADWQLLEHFPGQAIETNSPETSYPPPTSQATHTKTIPIINLPPERKASKTPEIWNPDAVGVYSFFLTPVWGSILLSKNWVFLKNHEKAGKARMWGWAWLIIVLAYILLPKSVANVPTIVPFILLLIVWYFIVVKEQVNYLKITEISYYKNAWLKPLLLGIGSIIIFIMIMGIVLTALTSKDVSEDQISEIAISLITKIAQQETNLDIYCESVKIEEKTSDNTYIGTARLNDETLLKINITLNGNEVLVEIPPQ